MEPVKAICGRAISLAMNNIDTDQIIPARYLYRRRSDGFADTLFHDMRYDRAGNEIPDSPLNQGHGEDAEILVALDNFGCGSSREHAVWALVDAGYRAVIAISFADIFRNNAFENGLLPVVLSETEVRLIHERIEARSSTIEIDLQAQSVTLTDGKSFNFDIAPSAKENLLLGRGKIDATRALSAKIDAFEAIYLEQHPWAH